MGVPLQLETRGIYPLYTLLINTRNVEKKIRPKAIFFGRIKKDCCTRAESDIGVFLVD
jgi:hypothetical protein